jgi:hypothetical protein
VLGLVTMILQHAIVRCILERTVGDIKTHLPLFVSLRLGLGLGFG